MASDRDKKHLSLVPNDGQTLMPPAPPGKPPVICRDLMKLRNVAKEVTKVYRQMRRGEIPSQEGTRAVYVLGKLADVLELVEVVDRLEQLEKLYGDNSR